MRKFFTLFTAMMFAVSAMASLQSLKLVNRQLCTADNNPVQLRGWTTQSGTTEYCSDKSDFEKMKTAGANVVRIVIDPKEYTKNGSDVTIWVKNCVDWCAELDMYCIIEWDMLDMSNPNDAIYTGATLFFDAFSSYIASLNYHHVLYEICGGPYTSYSDGSYYQAGKSDWEEVKTYAKIVMSVIKVNDPNAIIIVGTPFSCNGLVFPMVDPMDEQDMNVMYSYKMDTYENETSIGTLSAASAFLPVFVSQWSFDGDYNDILFGASKLVADLLMNVCNGQNISGQKISWCNYGWFSSSKISAAFKKYETSTWSDAGNYVKGLLASNPSVTRSTEVYDEQQINGENDAYIALEKYDNGGPYNAYWDIDDSWMPCGTNSSTDGCNVGIAGQDGVRSKEMVDLGYTDVTNKEDGYISLSYTFKGEWVQYSVNVKVAGNYEFELFPNNVLEDNIMAIAVDGENALVDAFGQEHYKAFQAPPCKGGLVYDGYNDYGWVAPKSLVDENAQFRIRFKTVGEHKLTLVFVTVNGGLGSLKLKGMSTQAINQITNDQIRKCENLKILRDGQLFIEYNGKTYNTLGTEVN